MTNFLRDRRSKNNQHFPTILGIGIGIVVLMVVLFPRWGGGVLRMDERVWDLQNSFTMTSRSLVASKKNLIQEIELLEERMSTLEIERLQYTALAPELSRLPVPALSRSTALVVTRPPQTLYDSFVLNRGTNDGFSVGDRVYIHGQILFGLITKVSKTTAHMVAFSSPQQTIPVYHSVSGSTVMAKGQGNGNFLLEVPQEINIAAGDVLLAEGDTSYVVGVVEDIIIDERDPFKDVYVRVPTNINSIRYVQVETKSI